MGFLMLSSLSESVILAGMPSFSLTDLAKMRFEVLSFFLLTFLISAFVLKLAWNYLAADFRWMPKVGFLKSIALLGVTGLFLYVVLTMISGARELMTPGAWTKTGVTYKLKNQSEPVLPDYHRRLMIAKLWEDLREYSLKMNSSLPQQRLSPGIPVESWIFRFDENISMPYEYIGGETIAGNGDEKRIIAYEPPLAGDLRFVLYNDGSIEKLDWSTVIEHVNQRKEIDE